MSSLVQERYQHCTPTKHVRHASTLSVLAGDCVQRHDRGRPDCDCATYLRVVLFSCTARVEIVVRLGFLLFLWRHSRRVGVPRGCSPALEPAARPFHSGFCSSDVFLRMHLFAPTPVHTHIPLTHTNTTQSRWTPDSSPQTLQSINTKPNQLVSMRIRRDAHTTPPGSLCIHRPIGTIPLVSLCVHRDAPTNSWSSLWVDLDAPSLKKPTQVHLEPCS